MAAAPLTQSILVVVPAFGGSHLTDAVLADLSQGDRTLVPNLRIVVVDNKGDYDLPSSDPRATVHHPAGNIRWIGATNWGLRAAQQADDDIFIVLNNDTRLSPDFIYWLAFATFQKR